MIRIFRCEKNGKEVSGKILEDNKVLLESGEIVSLYEDMRDRKYIRLDKWDKYLLIL